MSPLLIKISKDFATLWTTIDPIANVALFAGLTAALTRKERHLTALRGVIYATIILVAPSSSPVAAANGGESPRAQVTIENWDKGGALSHWAFTHMSEIFPSAVVRRGGTIVELPLQLRSEIGA
ncbi:MAG: hypothetical protein J2P56_06660, partial [Verrucomicrobia bacterium]|nr:hypothetical protein [Verrucomicrobiota bacterium]